MSQRNQNRPARQKNLVRWLAIGGVLLAIIAGIWVVLSNQSARSGQAQPISQLTTHDFHSLAFSLMETDTVFFGHHGGLLVSHNGGKDWQPTTLQNADAMALAFPRANPQLLYAAGHDVFYKSTDGGQTWQSVTTNLPGTDIHGFAADPDNPDTVYAHVTGFGIFGSQNGGVTWTQLSATVPPSTFNLIVGENPRTLYLAAGQAGLWRSVDGGQVWTQIDNAPDNGALAVTYAPARHRLYVTTVGGAAGVYVSEDSGGTWNSVGLQGTLLALAVSPQDAKHLIAVNDKGQVYASRNDGVTWNNK